MKKILALLTAVAMILVLGACKGEETDLPDETENGPAATVRIGFLKGPTGIGASFLMEENENGNTANSYEFTVAGGPDELTGRLISGDLDMAALPTNAIATLYAKTNGGIQILGINTLGVLYILEKGESISSVADLEGRTILASGQGSTAEYVLSYILEKNGVSAEIYWASEHSEAATLALSGEYDVVMLPEPFVTSVTAKDGGFRIAVDLTREWELLDGGNLPMGGIAVRREFAEQNPEAVEAFISEYGKSVGSVLDEREKAAELCEKYDIIAAAVAEKAIPRCNIVWLYENYEEMFLKYLETICEMNPQSVGGQVPDEGIFA